MRRSNKRLLLLLILATSTIVGCNNAFFEIDTEVKLIDGSYPPSFKITGNGSSPIFLMFGPYEGDYGKDGNPFPLWELVPKPDAQGIDVNRYSPFTYGQIPVGYRQNKPKDNQPPKLLEVRNITSTCM